MFSMLPCITRMGSAISYLAIGSYIFTQKRKGNIALHTQKHTHTHTTWQKIDFLQRNRLVKTGSHNYRNAIFRPTHLVALVFVEGMSAVKILQLRDGAMYCTFFII